MHTSFCYNKNRSHILLLLECPYTIYLFPPNKCSSSHDLCIPFTFLYQEKFNVIQIVPSAIGIYLTSIEFSLKLILNFVCWPSFDMQMHLEQNFVG